MSEAPPPFSSPAAAAAAAAVAVAVAPEPGGREPATPLVIEPSPSGRHGLRESAVDPARQTIAEILDRLPTSPGVYLMKDRRGKAVYIGKAGNLRTRVRQYFQPGSGDDRLFIPLLEGIVVDIETVLTHNEKEALLLENTLIKRHQPRFNVNLRDDKNYLVLRLDPEGAWPRLEVVRKMASDGAYYFGPYHSATSCREALRVVNRHFQLRTCTDHVLANRRRPCLQYQIKRCPAPCVLEVDREDYGDQVRDVRYFLEGKDDELVARLEGRMKDAAARTEFERAAAIRDQLRALEVTLESQRVVSTDFVDQDVIGFYREGMALEIVVMVIRQGKLVGNKSFSFGGQEFPDSELLSSFVGLLYDSAGAAIPDEVLLPIPIDDAELKAEWLSERRPERRRKVEVLVPQRADRKRLIELADKNARASFASRRNAREDTEVMLAKLQKRLRLTKLPRVIECYDISHIQGFAPVASMVVFVDGRPDRARYRTYRVRGPEASTGRRGNDDFASMYEVLSRRFRRARQADAGWELPDLIVIDGGKGQLGMALAAARDCDIDTRPGQGLAIIGLAKERDDAAAAAATPEDNRPPAPAGPAESAAAQPSAMAPEAGAATMPDAAAVAPVAPESPRSGEAGVDDPGPAPTQIGDGGDGGAPRAPGGTRSPMPGGARKKGPRRGSERDAAADSRRPDRIFLPNAKDAIPIRPSSAEMFVLQQLRDEAHRFAIAFHRRRRGQLTLRSVLEEVPGIGEARQKALLRYFGSVRKIREATREELESVPGMTRKAAAAVLAHLGRATPGDPLSAPDGAAIPQPDPGRVGGEPPSAERVLARADGPGPGVGAPPLPAPTEEEATDEALENAFAAIEEDGELLDVPAIGPGEPGDGGPPVLTPEI
jgi:excinuclease ABC subunit C